MWIYRNVECGQTWTSDIAVRARWTQTVPQHLRQPHPVCIETICFSVYSLSVYKASTGHQNVQFAILFFGTFKPVFLLLLTSHLSPSPNLVLFSPPLTLIFSPSPLCCCLCQKDHILRLVIAFLLASTPVAVNVVVWDGRELCPLASVTWNPLKSTFSADVNPQRSRKIMGRVCTCLVTGNPDLHL